ncbi:MAG: hypothetical protein ABR990_06330 [Terracidiphilus sp.]|jgi:hypothetical protein
MDRNDAGLATGRRFAAMGACFAALLIVFAGLAAAQEAAETKPKVSSQPLTAEQLGIYRTVLHGWMDNELSMVNLSIQTIPYPTSGAFDAGDCGKDLELEPVVPTVVHRFRVADLAQLGSDKIVLVDPERQSREVAENDPGKTIGEGRSIEDAVRNGFAHGLVTVSEIRFDKQHKHAIVSYSFFCGSLCGNGGTIILEKVDGAWQRKSQCSNWIS